MVSNHPNVLRLEGVLEFIQDSKTTIFLCLELANGGELFDRIQVEFQIIIVSLIFYPRNKM